METDGDDVNPSSPEVDNTALEQTLAANRARLMELQSKRLARTSSGSSAKGLKTAAEAPPLRKKPDYSSMWGDDEKESKKTGPQTSLPEPSKGWLKSKQPAQQPAVQTTGQAKQPSPASSPTRQDLPPASPMTAPSSPDMKEKLDPKFSYGATFGKPTTVITAKTLDTSISYNNPSSPLLTSTSSASSNLSSPYMAPSGLTEKPTSNRDSITVESRPSSNLRAHTLPTFTALPSPMEALRLSSTTSPPKKPIHEKPSSPLLSATPDTKKPHTPPDSTSPSPPPSFTSRGLPGTRFIEDDTEGGSSFVEESLVSDEDGRSEVKDDFRAEATYSDEYSYSDKDEFLSGFDQPEEERNRILGADAGKHSVISRGLGEVKPEPPVGSKGLEEPRSSSANFLMPPGSSSGGNEEEDGYTMEFDDSEDVVSEYPSYHDVDTRVAMDSLKPSNVFGMGNSLESDTSSLVSEVKVVSKESTKAAAVAKDTTPKIKESLPKGDLVTTESIPFIKAPAVDQGKSSVVAVAEHKKSTIYSGETEKANADAIKPLITVSEPPKASEATSNPSAPSTNTDIPENPTTDSLSKPKPDLPSLSKEGPPKAVTTASRTTSSTTLLKSQKRPEQEYLTFSDFLNSNPEVAANLEKEKEKEKERASKSNSLSNLFEDKDGKERLEDVKKNQEGGVMEAVKSGEQTKPTLLAAAESYFMEAALKAKSQEENIKVETKVEGGKENAIVAVYGSAEYPARLGPFSAFDNAVTALESPSYSHVSPSKSLIPRGTGGHIPKPIEDPVRPRPFTAPTLSSARRAAPARPAQKAAVLGRINQRIISGGKPNLPSTGTSRQSSVSPSRRGPDVKSRIDSGRKSSVSPVRSKGGRQSPVKGETMPVEDELYHIPALSQSFPDATILASAAARTDPNGFAIVPSRQALIEDSAIADMQSTIARQGAEIESLKTQLREVEVERDRMKEELAFVEKLREQEREAMMMSSKLPITSSSLASKMVGANSADGNGIVLPKEDVERIRKEILEQETLIRGYQTENERLVEQNKNMRAQLKESERRFSIRVESLQRDLATVRQGGAVPAPGANPPSASGAPTAAPKSSNLLPTTLNAGDSARLAILAEDLEQRLLATQRDAADREGHLTGEIAKLRGQLADANGVIASFRGRSEEEVTAYRSKMESDRAKLEAYVVELESKLERESQKVEMAYAEVEKRDFALANMSGGGDAGQNFAKGGKNGKRGGVATKPARLDGDARRIRELERMVSELQEKLVHRNRNAGLSSSRGHGVIEEADYIRHLKDRIQRVEAEREAVESAWEAKLKALHSEANALRDQYEGRLAFVQSQFDAAQQQASQQHVKNLEESAITSQNRVLELERQLETLLKSYDERLKIATEESSTSIAERNKRRNEIEAELNKQKALFKAKEKALLVRIGELDAIVDSQAATLESIRGERANAEKDLAQRLRERDALVASYEARIAELRNEFHDRIFGGEEQKWMEEIRHLRLELETLKGENSTLKSRLEVSEATRKAVHENTITILKQAQEDSANLALTHQERALAMLREEAKAQATAMLDLELKRLRSDLADAQVEVARWKARATSANSQRDESATSDQEKARALAEDKVKALEQQVSLLHKEKQQLEENLKKAKSTWPPEQKRFDEVEEALKKTEQDCKEREMELQRVVDEVQKKSEEDMQRTRTQFLSMLKKKDDEIRHFRDEVDALLMGLEELREMQMRGV
ncbi:hypothetical protein HDU97_004807 [Phlyctochytrium planicorne]|nr:hypothetical protein HDU97_004807 [Phlyctochytrium planicorne]